MQIVLCYMEVRPIKEDDLIRLERDNARMVRWMCNVMPEDWISAEERSIGLIRLNKIKEYEEKFAGEMITMV